MTPEQIEAKAREPITSWDGWERIDRDPGEAKKALSARVPDQVSTWIFRTAAETRQTPSALIADLLAEAIAARTAAAGNPRPVVDLAAAVQAVQQALTSLPKAA